MKKSTALLTILLFIITGGIGCKQSATQNEEIITVDVRATYPKKELILQDFMDVEYIALETNDNFVNQGFVQAIGKEVILVKNYKNDGDIFVYDRTGKAIRKINRKGQGGEEYTFCRSITLDDDNHEIFINDHYARKIQVYDLEGNFKRSLRYKEGTGYDKIYNFDHENLICYDGEVTDDGVANMQSFLIVSKQDGSITKEIQIPFEEKIITFLMTKDE